MDAVFGDKLTHQETRAVVEVDGGVDLTHRLVASGGSQGQDQS
jgi:hypothetical protein